MAARTEAQLRRIADLERHIHAGGSAGGGYGGGGGGGGASPPQSAGPGRASSAGTLADLTGPRSMEARLRRLAALEAELGERAAASVAEKEELDVLLAQWSAGPAGPLPSAER